MRCPVHKLSGRHEVIMSFIDRVLPYLSHDSVQIVVDLGEAARIGSIVHVDGLQRHAGQVLRTTEGDGDRRTVSYGGPYIHVHN